MGKRRRMMLKQRLEAEHQYVATQMKRTSKAQIKARLIKRGSRCHWCGTGLCYKTATLDHVRPKSKGGTNRPENLVLSCFACNQEKGNLTNWVKMN